MTKAQAIHKFWSGFGLPAYEENSVPSGTSAPSFPYITYQMVTGSYGDSIPTYANIWDKDRNNYSANSKNNSKADEISKSISDIGIHIPCDGGSIWIYRGSPFAQSMSNESDTTLIKRKYLNVTVEFFTVD